MENNYYVYGYLRLDNRNQHFMNILNKEECAVEILSV